MRSENVSYGIGYAGAESDYNDADAVIFGIPYDHTACFKAGAREAPWTIRRASYNFEEIHFEHGVDQPVLNVYDYGNCDDFVLPECCRKTCSRRSTSPSDPPSGTGSSRSPWEGSTPSTSPS